MGIIGRTVRKRGNQQFAAPLRISTDLSISEVVESLYRMSNAHNEHKQSSHTAALQAWSVGTERERRQARKTPPTVLADYFLSAQDDCVLVGWRATPEDIVAVKRPLRHDKSWLAAVSFPDGEENAGSSPSRLVEVTLLKWVTDSEGRLQSKEHYEHFCNEFLTRVTNGATS